MPGKSGSHSFTTCSRDVIDDNHAIRLWRHPLSSFRSLPQSNVDVKSLLGDTALKLAHVCHCLGKKTKHNKWLKHKKRRWQKQQYSWGLLSGITSIQVTRMNSLSGSAILIALWTPILLHAWDFSISHLNLSYLSCNCSVHIAAENFVLVDLTRRWSADPWPGRSAILCYLPIYFSLPIRTQITKYRTLLEIWKQPVK